MTNRWVFPPASGGEFDGFKDAGIEYFTGNPYSALAREVIQNSLDAADENKTEPVRVHFDLIKVRASEFPDREGLAYALKNSHTQAKKLADLDALEFFERAQEVLSAKTIQMLRMSDSNTSGLIGPCELGTPYYAFIKATGQSLKSSKTAGGSYGIGKNAPFALSDLRTIFVSTWYRRGSKCIELAQGKSILMSHVSAEKRTTRARGYYGKLDCSPICPETAIPTWLSRNKQIAEENNKQGTSVFIAGFRGNTNWPGLIISSVITNYFSAIFDGTLEVFVDNNKHVVDKTTLKKWFTDRVVTDAAATEDAEDRLGLAGCMARCLFDEGAQEESSQLTHLGHCRVRLLVEPGLPKRVGVLRNGMLVTHRLKRLVQFPGLSDFVAIVDCLDSNGNEFLRAIENPEHNDFEPPRLRDPKDVKRAQDELGRLADFVRKSLKKHAQAEKGQITKLDELAEFFQDPDEEVATSKKSDSESDIQGAMQLLPKPPRKKSVRASYAPPDQEGETGGSGGESGGGDGGQGGDGPGTGSGSGGRGDKGKTAKREIHVRDVRCIVVSKTEREIMFTPESSGVANLSVEEVGADLVYPINVKKVKAGGGKVEKGRITRVRLHANQRKKLRVVLDNPFDGAIRVVAHEV